jgi:hypothetical protein
MMKVTTEDPSEALINQLRLLTEAVDEISFQIAVLTTRAEVIEPSQQIETIIEPNKQRQPVLYCSGITTKNRNCRNPVTSALKFCPLHNPDFRCCAGMTLKSKRCLLKVAPPHNFCSEERK